ncbi:pilus assembly PilX family protein [Roseibacillus persicicus]|uniref:pilus assembly PilX family protein n=1 Tax=Roseibacillus persicicus TaxID=454148 RepID=UPI00280D39F4|nr:hypothetical protein [Roseibacillus persicicus]MDQ8189176.1 hypothetical protein [Roseibacillus persicicus]
MKLKIQSLGSPRQKKDSSRGFAMMVTVLIMILLSLIATGLLTLSTVEMRAANISREQQIARSNAKLALTIAVGELQTYLGPDKRVSAQSSILENNGSVNHPHWTGVWSTRQENGDSFWRRDDNEGGLHDVRYEKGWDARDEVLSYLVSGNEGGRGASEGGLLDPFGPAEDDASWVKLVGEGSLGFNPNPLDEVVVPKVKVESFDGQVGSYGFWVGDLGVRANVATPNVWNRDGRMLSREEELFPLLASQESDATMMVTPDGQKLDSLTRVEKGRLATDGQLPLLSNEKWAPGLWHDLTTWSQGVLADTRDGGLRKNLTAYLQSSYSPEPDVLSDGDNLVGPRNPEHAAKLGQSWSAGRYRMSAPTFGMLRDWVQNSVGLNPGVALQRNSETAYLDSTAAGSRSAFANDETVKLVGRTRSDLKPVVVEGSMYSTFSYHLNPEGFAKKYNIRFHQWPRVVLWNPYNVEISVPQSVMMLQLNSRNDFRTSIRTGGFVGTVQWISWGGGTRTPPPRSGESITESANYNDPYSGMRYFSLPAQVIGPGECLVFSPEQAAEYNSRNVLANRLSASVAPDPSRNFYISSSEFDEDDTGSGFNFEILRYFYYPAQGLDNQADDARMIWKDASGLLNLDIYSFDRLPQLSSVSCSLQYGAGKEPRLAINEINQIDVEFTDLKNPVIANRPDVRSREGFRLRWLEEHLSNVSVGNNPAGPYAFETAPLANWNMRASYALRSPWSNIAGDQGDGIASGPWFFGAYTRDLYDQAVSWDEQLPFFHDGLYRGNPFGPPQEGRVRNVLFELPREQVGIISIAQLQHAKLSEFIWHPTYAIGNSLVDPRLELRGMAGTSPSLLSESDGGWNADAIGWSNDVERSEERDEWARFARFIVQELPQDENLVYDLSYEVNHALFDEFFLSSGDEDQRREFVEEGEPLPNGRMRLVEGGTVDDLNSITRAASKLMVDGAFNVNSTSVEAWKALLASTRQSGLSSNESSPFPRAPQAQSGEYLSGSGFPEDDEAWSGFRSLSDAEIEALATEIVEQVKLRGPFLSLSDFVNRGLVGYGQGEIGTMGPLQAAIEAAGLNREFIDRWELFKQGELPDYSHPDNISDSTRISQTLKPDSKAWGAPGYLTQADLLQVIGPVLSARSDTFVVRCYGDAKDSSGRITAKAWCEAVVQRTPQPIAPDQSGLNPDPNHASGRFGRQFEVRSFRWLSEEEV